MDNTTYPGSVPDTDLSETYENCDFYSMASNDFVDQWVNVTVEKEILRGSKLREEKLRSYPQQDEYEVANINLVRSPCVKIKTSHYRKSLPRSTKMKTGSCTQVSNPTFMRRSSSSRAYSPQMTYPSQMTYTRQSSPKLKAKNGPRCPMRIAELAVPTKRQCIDTWRNKHDVLPAFMVERLKQQTMDERPIVQIKEAISCFKRAKPRSLNSLNRSKKSTRGSKQKNERIDEIRNFCAAFGNKIAQRLIIPQNLKLTNEWENISKIVAGDIAKIINRKKYDLNVVTSKRIQAEIADKITVWIARILAETSYKILEEDLKELEEEEGPVLDFIDDLMENVMTTCEPQEKDIHENDDFSETKSKSSEDKLNETIVSPDPTYGTGDDAVNKMNEIHLTASTGLIQETGNKSFDKNGIVEESTEININDHIRGEIVKIVDSAIPADQNDEKEVNNYPSDKDIDNQIKDASGKETDMAEKHQDLQKSPGNSELTAQLKDIPSDINLALTEEVVLSSKNSLQDSQDDPNSNTQNITANNDKDVVLSSKNSLQDSKDDPNSNTQKITAENEKSSKNSLQDSKDDPNFNTQNITADNEKDVVLNSKNSLQDSKDDPTTTSTNTQNITADNENVSGVFELLDGESLDDKDKKVKFSEIEMDVGGTTKQLDGNSGVESTERHSHEKERVSWHSSTDVHEMVFAPPNDHLLSDADESWPDDITMPVLKPSASVSRSITSLGKILEKDEKSILQDEIDWEAHQTELEILNRTDVNNIQTEQQLENVKKRNEQEAPMAAQIKDGWMEKESINEKNSEDVTDESAALSLDAIKTFEEKTMTYDKTVEANVPLEPENQRLFVDSSTSPFKLPKIEDIPVNNQTTIRDKQITGINNIESDTNLIYEAVLEKMKSSYAMPEPKHDYKVHAATAPSWLRHDHGKGEPSEDSFRGGQPREKYNETEIRSWCKDLDRIFINLEMWNGWISDTCKNIIRLKKEREPKKLLAPNAQRKYAKDLIDLKKNIDKNTVLWTKLNQRACEMLKIYKDRTKIVSTEYCMLCDCKNNINGRK